MPTRSVQSDAIVSVHDVMPETLPAVSELLEQLAAKGFGRLLLLIVPGKNWSDAGIDTLRDWQCQGHELAGHGWHHQVATAQLRGPWSRLHSKLISRNVAEHLALGADGILALLSRCHSWFQEHELELPDYYVPPAWAMGRISYAQLAESPFRRFEYLTGIYCTDHRSLRRLPLVGYEANDLLRAATVRFWNRLNESLIGPQRPLRIAIHPHDMSYRLAKDLSDCLDRFSNK